MGRFRSARIIISLYRKVLRKRQAHRTNEVVLITVVTMSVTMYGDVRGAAIQCYYSGLI